MLIQFVVENYRSFKNAAILSLEGDDSKYLNDNFVNIGNSKCLKVVSIFGANAAGKSNLFKALTAAILIVRKSNSLQPNQPIGCVVPYAFEQEVINKPTKFEFTFIHNNKKFKYGFGATANKIFTEYLYAYKSAKKSIIFERDNKGYNIPGSLQKELQPLTQRTLPNKLFLAVATTWNSQYTKDAFSWFMEKIDTYSQDNTLNELAKFNSVDKVYNEKLKQFTLGILHHADINITDYNVQMGVPLPFFINSPMFSMSTQHIINNDGEVMKKPLNLMSDESQGTQYVFSLIPMIKRAFEEGCIICFDEFDAHLHPLLLRYLISLFNNPMQNKANAQLIISAHSMALLDEKFMRRDQIYFVEKDRNTGISELYSLDEFPIEKQENIRKMYLEGRYGSIPDIEEDY